MQLLFEDALSDGPGRRSFGSEGIGLGSGGWRLGFPRAEPYLIGGWSEPLTADRGFRWTTEPVVRALVPNLMPEGQRLTLWLAPGGTRRVTLRWDGEVVAEAALSQGWNRVWFDVPAMPVGEHELAIEAKLGTFGGLAGWPMPARPVGVAVNLLELELLPP